MAFDLRHFFTSQDGPITVVSPFIKRNALETAFSLVDPDVPAYIFTRWLPIEVATGVSDLSVFDWTLERGNARIRLLRELHAKAYIRGSLAAVGSANLTGRGMGWATNPNLELLLTVPSDNPALLSTLERLRRRSIPATGSIRTAIQEAADKIGNQIPIEQLTVAGDEGLESQDGGGWIPATSEPRRLFDAYSPGGGISILQSTQEDAEQDLAVLQIPEGYDLQRFIGHIRAVFMQSIVFTVVDSALQAGSDPKHALQSELGLDPDQADESWVILQEWLTYFIRDRYRAEPQAGFRIVRSRAVE